MYYDKTAKTPQQIKEAVAWPTYSQMNPCCKGYCFMFWHKKTVSHEGPSSKTSCQVKSKVEEGNPRPKDVLERVTSSISPTDQKQKFKEADNDEDEGENGDGGEKTAGSARGKGKGRGRGGKGRGRGRGRGKTPGKRSSSTSCKGCEKPNKKAKSGKGAKDLATFESRPTASEEPPSSTSKPRRRLRPLSEKPEDSKPEEDAKMPKTRKVSNKPEKDAKSSLEALKEALSSTCKPRRARKEKDASGSQEEPSSSSTSKPRRARKEKDARGSQEELSSSSTSKPRRARKEKDAKGSQEEEPSPSTRKPRRARKGAEKPEDPKSEKGAKKSKKEPSSTSKPREPRKISKKPASKRMRSKVKIEEETNQVNQETLGSPEMLESGPPATPAAPEPEGRPLRRRDDPEEKAKRSRKSSAYHVAKRAALKDGHSKEKALEMASQAPLHHIRACTWK